MADGNHTLLRLGEWHAGLDPATRPDWSDVEIVERMGVRDSAGTAELLLSERAKLIAFWDELEGRLTPMTAGPSSAPLAAVAPAAEPVVGAALASELDELETAASTLEGEPGQRLRVLMNWRSRMGDSREELSAVTDQNYMMLAKEGVTNTRVWARLGPLSAFRDELVALLSEARDTVGPITAPVEPVKSRAGTTDVRSGSSVSDSTPESAEPVAAQTAVTSVAPVRELVAESADASTVRGQSVAVSVAGFAPFDYAATPVPGVPETTSFSATGDESLRISWPAPPVRPGVQIFRVVTSASYLPDGAPELGKTIAATLGHEAVDTDDFASPVRHVAIWLNEGATSSAAKAAQPVLYATGGTVLPVRDLDVREDSGTVIGQWKAIQGLGRVDVFRVPMEIAQEYKHYNAGEKLAEHLVTQGGFTDSDALPGVDYEYRVYAVAAVSGDEEDFSPYVARPVRMQALVRAVDDLVVVPHAGSDDVFDLSWTMPPQGRVEIYRSEMPPASGIDVDIIERSALQRQGLGPDQLLRRPTDVVGGRGSMVEVPWPEGWSRAYFTPVTVLNDSQIRVGPYRILVRAKEVSHVQLIERVDEQFITFAWPDGVVLVKVYQGPSDTELSEGVLNDPNAVIEELGEDDYRKFGGVHLRNPLSPEGCSVHLVATSFSEGLAMHSAPVTVQYRGLLRLHYDLPIVELAGKLFGARSQSTIRRVVIRAQSSASNLPIVLVHNATRLPLHPGDGIELERRSVSFGEGTEMVFLERLDVAGRGGFLRVFVDAPPAMAHLVAVMDPPVSHLRLG